MAGKRGAWKHLLLLLGRKRLPSAPPRCVEHRSHGGGKGPGRKPWWKILHEIRLLSLLERCVGLPFVIILEFLALDCVDLFLHTLLILGKRKGKSERWGVCDGRWSGLASMSSWNFFRSCSSEICRKVSIRTSLPPSSMTIWTAVMPWKFVMVQSPPYRAMHFTVWHR